MNVKVPKWSFEKKELKSLKPSPRSPTGFFPMYVKGRWDDFKEEIRNVEIWLNIYQFFYVLKSTFTDMNVFVLDATTMLPYVGLESDYDERLPCVVILYFFGSPF